MSTLYENIKELCDEKGISGGKMCLEVGISKSTLTSLKNGRTKAIKTENIQKIADYFGVSVDRVLHGKYPESIKIQYEGYRTGREDERSHQKELLELSEQKKKAAIDVVDDDLQEYLDELRNRPDKRMLFSVTKNATKSQIEAIVKMIEEMQGDQ